uniref:Uncharacterized protein n=1 Tax=Acrobeloides nanus TaxID=290746 RepID=A0A914E5R1_9BILA
MVGESTQIAEFNVNTDKWSTYKKKQIFYFEINGIVEYKKTKAYFISSYSLPILELLKSLIAFKNLEDVAITYVQLVEELDKRYEEEHSPKHLQLLSLSTKSRPIHQ